MRGCCITHNRFDSTIDLPTELITFSISTCFYGYLQFHAEGRQELLFDQDFKIVTMGSKKRKWPFPDIFQLTRNLFSSDSKEFVALPSCSNQDVSDPNLF